MLGFTAMLMDSSSEMVHAILPNFLVAGLGASVAMVGLIDGLAEATASITKIFSGALSDHWRNRKHIAAFGYGLSAASKIIFPLAGTPLLVFVGRFADRFGKGVRGAPRDALVADWVSPEHRGYAYGVRQALDNIGAVAGPLLAIVLMQFYLGDFVPVLWWAVVPAVLAVLVMSAGVEEPEPNGPHERRPFPLLPSELKALKPDFWLMMGLLFVMLLPRFSEAFMLLRATDRGVPLGFAPLVLIIMSATSVPFTPIAGIWSDRYGRHVMIAGGFGLLILSHAALAYATSPAFVWLGSALWGLHLALTQGVFSALVADHAPAHLRGTAFGVFNLASGIAIFIGSYGMGIAWDALGPAMAFGIAAAMTAAALLLYLIKRP